MTLPGADTPFVFLDDSRSADAAGRSLLFHTPDRIICARLLDEVPNALAEIDEAVAAGFFVAGWMAYECAGAFEQRARAVQVAQSGQSHVAGEPLIWMMVTKRRECLQPEDVQKWLRQIADDGQKMAGGGQGRACGSIELSEPAISLADYRRVAARIKDYIDAGDIYQANYTFPHDCVLEGSLAQAYQNLRQRQPVEYGAFINAGINTGSAREGCKTIMSFSPELFVRRSGSQIMARPMKGTAARCPTVEEDRAAVSALRRDEKSRAENLMIVDLIRNDLSRVAVGGSVAVTDMFTVETFPTLHQMTSGVEAEVDDGLLPSTLLKALFPCGSVTGAPKIRAMEIIAELETGPRGVYCGAIGHFSPAKEGEPADWCLNVPIRTIVLNENGAGRLAVGSGIVADSDIDAEYAECLLKAAFAVAPGECAAGIQTEAPAEDFHLIETMKLHEGEVCLKERHIFRLLASAGYFGIAVDRRDIDVAIGEALDQCEGALSSDGERDIAALVYKLRMTVDLAGTIATSVSEVEAVAGNSLMVGLAQNTIDSRDPVRRHKTSRRLLYDRASVVAQEQGLADILFLNERGELAEGAISNIFVETEDGWYTPPLKSGALPGVLRAELLEATHFRLTEKNLFLPDLRNAKALYIGNALRGLRQVRIQDADQLIL